MNDRRRRKKNPYFTKIGEVLQHVCKKKHLNLPAKDPRMWEAWTASVGPLITAQTSVDKLKNDVLFVKVSNSVWMQQLQFMKNDILGKLNCVLGDQSVKHIFFSIGSIPGPPERDEITFNPDAGTLSEKDALNIERCLSVLTDSELANILRRVMTKDLKRRQRTT